MITVPEYFEEFLTSRITSDFINDTGIHSIDFSVSLRDINRSWQITISDDKKLTVSESELNKTPVEFVMDTETFKKVVSNEITPQGAFFKGLIKINGGTVKGMQVAGFFSAFTKANPYSEFRCEDTGDSSNDFQEIINVEIENGENTNIKAAYSDETDCSKIAVLFPPHPSMGGNSENNIVKAICRKAAEKNHLGITFNYRGIDSGFVKSEPVLEYWDGIEKKKDFMPIVRDSLKVVEKVRKSFCQEAEIFYIGYSFGSLVALMLNKILPAKHCVCISPPLDEYDFESLISDNNNITVITGIADEFCPIKKALKLSIKYRFELKRIDSEDHFHRGNEEKLAEVTLENMEK